MKDVMALVVACKVVHKLGADRVSEVCIRIDYLFPRACGAGESSLRRVPPAKGAVQPDVRLGERGVLLDCRL